MLSRVLIVEDHPAMRNVVRWLFEREGFEVFEAVNGTEGVQKAEELHPSLVVLDLYMPGMNGLDAARALRRKLPEVPLLMFTNTVVPGLEREARSAGISAVVSKSDPTEKLVAEARGLVDVNRQYPEADSDG
jgi:CheY-like chemotaxis protein